MDLPCEGQVLLVGDGDFSFTLSLIKKGSLRGSQVTTSNLENVTSIQQHKLAADNMKTLTEMGVQVYLETDARELHTHPVINQIRYQRIIFNFPLADRHNIKKNRALLADFFSSCAQILSDDGQVMVTLCQGQGGTPADQPMRSWHDSWQVCLLSANAGFILRDVHPFDASKYTDYHSVGFRFQDKSFNTDGALTHVFEKADVVVNDDVCARGIVESGTDTYTCSRYVAEKLHRNLLHDSNNPLCQLRERLEASFSLHLGAEVIPEKQDCCFLPGHKSRITVKPRYCGLEESRGTDMSSVCKEVCNSSGDSLKTAKERKNEANLNIVKNAMTSLVHGVNRDAGKSNWDTSPGHKDCKISQLPDDKLQILKFIPENSESVFILIKGTNGSTTDISNDVEIRNHNDQNEDKASEMDGSWKDDCATKANIHSLECSAVDFDTQCPQFMQETKHEKSQNAKADEQLQNCANRVFHCRTSLLENLSDMSVQAFESDSSVQMHQLNSSKGASCSKSLPSLASELISSCPEVSSIESPSGLEGPDLAKKIYEGALPEELSKCSHCFVMSGKCFLPGPIVPNTLAVRHEMMFVQKVHSNNFASETQKTHAQHSPHTDNTSGEASSATVSHFSTDASFLVNEISDSRQLGKQKHIENYVPASEHFVSCLKNSGVLSQTSINVQDMDSMEEFMKLDGFDSISNVKLIYLEPEPNVEDSLKQQGQGSKVVAGIVVTVARGSDQMLVSVLQLDNIVCQICNINDPRLLWSRSKKFTDQFQGPSILQRFTPFSLHPMMFVHDLSFWQKDSASEFDVGEMYSIIWYIAGDLVCKVTLIDHYTDPSTGQQSRCYRFHFTSHDMALPYLVSWKLQSQIRMEIAQKLDVILR